MGLIQIQDFNLPAVYVDDFPLGLRFYTEVLGFTKERDLPPGVLLRITKDLVLYLEGGRRPVTEPALHARTSLRFSTAEGMRASYQRLREAGVRMVGEYMAMSPERHLFRIADPAGNVIEFAGKP